uniref:Putative secreted protein n=1 Tax=Ixodes ricinus TaxID=34613 RepID=A0A6B0UX15_IXORI
MSQTPRPWRKLLLPGVRAYTLLLQFSSSWSERKVRRSISSTRLSEKASAVPSAQARAAPARPAPEMTTSHFCPTRASTSSSSLSEDVSPATPLQHRPLLLVTLSSRVSLKGSSEAARPRLSAGMARTPGGFQTETNLALLQTRLTFLCFLYRASGHVPRDC